MGGRVTASRQAGRQAGTEMTGLIVRACSDIHMASRSRTVFCDDEPVCMCACVCLCVCVRVRVELGGGGEGVGPLQIDERTGTGKAGGHRRAWHPSAPLGWTRLPGRAPKQQASRTSRPGGRVNLGESERYGGAPSTDRALQALGPASTSIPLSLAPTSQSVHLILPTSTDSDTTNAALPPRPRPPPPRPHALQCPPRPLHSSHATRHRHHARPAPAGCLPPEPGRLSRCANEKHISPNPPCLPMDQRRKREVSAIEAAQGAFGIERPRDRDDRKQTTIRSVTPDEPPIPEDGLAPQSFSPPNSPHSHNSQLSAARSANPRAFVARASSDSDYRNAREPTRPRTRTLEERTSRDRSPSTVFATQGRHRIGSVASSQSNYQSLEESVVTSIGHISTISPSSSTHQPPPRTSSTNSRGRLVKQQQQQQQAQPRSQSPVISPTTVPPESWLSPVPASDARKLKALMRSTCGKMHGLLAFRRGEQNPWALSYCYINDEAGSLVYEPKNDVSYTRTLIPDLRGCHVKSAYDGEAYTAYIHVVVHNSKLEVHLRPPTQEEFDSWFAALLCWSPMRPKGIQNRMAKPQTPVMMERRLTDSRRHSEVSLLKDSPKKEAPIIKVGKMIYWDTSVTYSNTGTPKSAGPNGRPQAYRLQSHGSRRWRRVSCTLRENGELKLYSDTDVTLVSTIQLSQLSRCAVQRLDPSVLDNEFCIAIYPQYTAASSSSLSIVRPIFLSLDSRVLYEVWIVLLRAFTVPQLYGPKSDAITEDGTLSPTFGTQDMFRMEKSLFVRVIEAKLIPPVSPKVADNNGTTPIRPSSSATANPGGYLVELLLDGETRARTMVKNEGNNPFWREEFEFLDLPALHTASLLLKKRPPSYSTRNDKNVFEAPIGNDSWVTEGGYAGISFDQTLGKTDIYLDDLGPNQEMEKWWPLVNMHGNTIGEVLVKVSSEECAILMARDYYPLSELLHRFSNGITLQVAQMIPNELRRLSEYLLNIFQVSGAAVEWICALVEEEIDGTLKESPASRLRFSKRLGSSESNESPSNTFGSASDRELFVRDMGNNAKLEANLLFRGNTLLTKSLDLHMKRLGKEYLEETLSEKLREINDKDPECEVDPNKVSSQHELDRNWRRLINCTEEVWRSIYNSVQRCPQELRLIFRHIRACADDRYGDYLRTVQYSSVSGFLFLRFFVPAVLNPKLFGLLKGMQVVRWHDTASR